MLIPAVVREVRAQRGEREVLEDDAADEPRRELQRQHGEPDERDERNQAEAGGRQNRRDRRDDHHEQHDAEDGGDLAQMAPDERQGQAHAGAHAHVLDRDHHLRHQVEEVDERDPDDQARSTPARRPRSRPSRIAELAASA